MNKVIYILLFTVVLGFSETIEEVKNSVDCLILEDENSIICKYVHERIDEDKEILVQWIDPEGELSRERTLLIPAGHGSIYDFRYISGRLKGIWQFKVIDQDIKLDTNFEIK
ncbi:hypothetical protein [Arcobacter sp. LA11]|uniref:hypothetical protein n=1 Tax=Arcobacter sp. LA11 TaxID=1898176 RepID=UPI0009348F7F|nr:hypothetical protein [Arcobacter sp. LA11]